MQRILRETGPGHVGGHGGDAQHHRFAGWFPQYTWRYTKWPLTDQHPEMLGNVFEWCSVAGVPKTMWLLVQR
jgi:hypothetical protein